MHVFLGNGKTRVAQNSCNMSYLIRQMQDHQKTCILRFSLHKSVYLKLFWTQLEKVHLQGPCCLRPYSSRPYCRLQKARCNRFFFTFFFKVPFWLSLSRPLKICIRSTNLSTTVHCSVLNTSYLTDSYISFTLKLESGQNFCSNKSIRSSTYCKKNIFEIPPCGSHFLLIHFTY